MEEEKLLNDNWSLYFHDPYNELWTQESYIHVSSIATIQEYIQLETLLKPHLQKGMFFLMREHIFPLWDDENNRNGGMFSIKILKANTFDAWSKIAAKLLGETLLKDRSLWENVNGISVSPKKHFCIIKIWMKDNSNQDALSYLDLQDVLMHKEVIYRVHES